MRLIVLSLFAIAVAACQRPPHPYPPEARAGFDNFCKYEARKCDCAWDKITRAMTFEEYVAAIDDFESRGVMDRRIVMASVDCAR